MPVLVIITGSNGAGKSSVGSNYVPDKLKNNVFDGDKLFMKKMKEIWSSGIRSNKECRKRASEIVSDTFHKLVRNAIKSQADFAYEGHFTNETTWEIPKKFKQAGYETHLIFFGLADINLSETRVIGRALEGGHYVDPLTIRSNYYGNLKMVDKYYSLFNSVRIFDTSGIEHVELAKFKNGIPYSTISLSHLPNWFKENFIEITKSIKKAEE